MKLYDSRRAPNPRRVRWFLAEKGIDDIEIVDVDLFAGAHKTPEYIGKAGVAQVPVLELDDGLAVSESIAICRYLESRYPEPNLFGRTPEEIAVIEQWMRRAEMYLATPLMMAVRHGHPALAALETQSPEYAEYSRADALKALKMFERQLAAYPFLADHRRHRRLRGPRLRPHGEVRRAGRVPTRAEVGRRDEDPPRRQRRGVN
jgi:glutathione S-transferase